MNGSFVVTVTVFPNLSLISNWILVGTSPPYAAFELEISWICVALVISSTSIALPSSSLIGSLSEFLASTLGSLFLSLSTSFRIPVPSPDSIRYFADNGGILGANIIVFFIYEQIIVFFFIINRKQSFNKERNGFFLLLFRGKPCADRLGKRRWAQLWQRNLDYARVQLLFTKEITFSFASSIFLSLKGLR